MHGAGQCWGYKFQQARQFLMHNSEKAQKLKAPVTSEGMVAK